MKVAPHYLEGIQFAVQINKLFHERGRYYVTASVMKELTASI